MGEDSTVELALKTGETAAEVEELEQKVESRNWWESITDDQITALFNRVSELESRIDILEAAEVAEEKEEPEVHRENPVAPEVTEIKPTESETPLEKAEPKKTSRRKGIFGLI